jgi:peptidoglycan/LPS O-acetylase OafA/YrhL
VVASTTGFKSLRELGGSALFFRNYVPVSMAGPMTGHLWSLAVEEHFYLLWPLLLSFVILRGASKAANLTGWIAIGCGLWRVANAQYSFGTNWLPLVPEHFRTDLRLDALLWGCVAALAIGDPGQAERIRKSFRPWMAWMGAVLCMVCVIFFSQLTSLWLAILIPVVLLGTLQHSEWAVSRMLDHKVVRWVGRISYSLYLWQQIFLIPGWEDRLWFQKGPWNLVATLILACASYWVIEKPCIALGRRLSSRPKRVEIPEPHPVIEAAGWVVAQFRFRRY